MHWNSVWLWKNRWCRRAHNDILRYVAVNAKSMLCWSIQRTHILLCNVPDFIGSVRIIVTSQQHVSWRWYHGLSTVPRASDRHGRWCVDGGCMLKIPTPCHCCCACNNLYVPARTSHSKIDVFVVDWHNAQFCDHVNTPNYLLCAVIHRQAELRRCVAAGLISVKTEDAFEAVGTAVATLLAREDWCHGSHIWWTFEVRQINTTNRYGWFSKMFKI